MVLSFYAGEFCHAALPSNKTPPQNTIIFFNNHQYIHTRGGQKVGCQVYTKECKEQNF